MPRYILSEHARAIDDLRPTCRPETSFISEFAIEKNTKYVFVSARGRENFRSFDI